jgi:hypothetical protein
MLRKLRAIFRLKSGLDQIRMNYPVGSSSVGELQRPDPAVEFWMTGNLR